MMTVIVVIIAVLIPMIAWFVYMTLAINADANRQDLVDAAPPIAADPSAFLRALHGATGERPSTGNQVDVYLNGEEIFPAMIDAIRGSRETVHFSTFVWWKGKTIPDQFAALFSEAAQRGVKVRIVIDSEGSESMSQPLLRQMREAGCQVAMFRRVRWNTWMRYNHRTHRRLLIVDGTVGFTGGVGVADEWSGRAESPEHWRDTHARVRGPAVSSLQAAFADNWNQATTELLLNARDYPLLEDAGAMQACIVVSTPDYGSSAAQRTMAAFIAGSTQTLHITNAYFVPTPAFIKNLCDASQRGVDVKVIVPGPHHDMPPVRHASWHVWPKLLAAGVKIYEYQPTMIHCKTLVADGQVSLIGSINFDPRSFALNLECAVVVSDAETATGMERAFAADLALCTPIDLSAVSSRRVLERARDAVCYWVRAQL
jgi:cardiolipin synthase A/B